MKFRILGDVFTSNKTYRGLYREEPQYSDEQDLYAFWDWYASEAGDGGFVTDVKKASSLIKSYADNGMSYEIIRIEDEEIETRDCFLGIDICTNGGYSLLATGLENSNKKTELDGVFELVKNYFQPKLNKNCLFQTSNDATLFLKVINEIQQIRPGMLEEDVFQKYYLYKVDIQF